MSTYNQCDGQCDEGTCELCEPEAERIATYSVKLYLEDSDDLFAAYACIIKRYPPNEVGQIVGIGTSDRKHEALEMALHNLKHGGPTCQHL